MNVLNRSLHTASVCLALLAGALPAQDYAEPEEPNWMAIPVYLRGMELRSPADMHGLEIRVVGREEGDNGFRSSTPLLDHADRTRRTTEADELYARRLAIYADSPTVDEWVDSSDPVIDELERTEDPAVAEPPEGSSWFLFVGGALVGLSGGWYWRRSSRSSIPSACDHVAR